ncbi:MAG: YIP1 family protein [Anaerolineaceae bacterium]|nr:YIP1 family protein [Anaerolineaceae bacterium]MBN2677794.1 YIP1 family protein [Anaerolineaceae bacterium]
MIERFLRALRLESLFYREAAEDQSLDRESTIVIILVALIASLGELTGKSGSWLAYLGTVTNSILFGWLLWAIVAWFVGRNILDGEGSLGGMLRVLAYASIPRLLGVFGGLPLIGWLFGLVGGILSLIAGIIAIREGMKLDTGAAIITALLGGLIYIAFSVLIGMLSLPFTLFG